MKAFVILDGTLLPIDRIATARPFYSGKHKRHGMTSTFHQGHPDAALARAPVPPKLINITRPIDK